MEISQVGGGEVTSLGSDKSEGGDTLVGVRSQGVVSIGGWHFPGNEPRSLDPFLRPGFTSQ